MMNQSLTYARYLISGKFTGFLSIIGNYNKHTVYSIYSTAVESIGAKAIESDVIFPFYWKYITGKGIEIIIPCTSWGMSGIVPITYATIEKSNVNPNNYDLTTYTKVVG